MAVITPRKTNDGTSVQNERPKSNASPGESPGSPTHGAAASGSTWVASSSRANTTEARVMERIIITVPPTMGVTMRRRINSQREMASWARAETITSVAKVAGPPSATAVMQNGMANAAVNIGSTAPAPTAPRRRTWISVDRPTTIREAKTIHTM